MSVWPLVEPGNVSSMLKNHNAVDPQSFYHVCFHQKVWVIFRPFYNVIISPCVASV